MSKEHSVHDGRKHKTDYGHFPKFHGSVHHLPNAQQKVSNFFNQEIMRFTESVNQEELTNSQKEAVKRVKSINEAINRRTDMKTRQSPEGMSNIKSSMNSEIAMVHPYSIASNANARTGYEKMNDFQNVTPDITNRDLLNHS